MPTDPPRVRAPEFDPDELQRISDELLAKRLDYNRRNRDRSAHAPISRKFYDRLVVELEEEEERRRVARLAAGMAQKEPCQAGLSPDCTGAAVRLVEAPGSNAAGLLLVCEPCAERPELSPEAFERAVGELGARRAAEPGGTAGVS